jgi:subtilisin-like proprotein convertase family protein
MLDALAAVRLAESWDAAWVPKTEANMLKASAAGAGFAVPDVGTASRAVALPTDLVVERAVLTLDLSHARIGDLVVSLVSPAGTESVLLDRLGGGAYGGGGRLSFQLTSNQFYGEGGAGTWYLKVWDPVGGGRAAAVNAWSLELFGAPQTPDDLYVYTDRFAGLAALEPARRTLADADGGVDTLNAAAVTTASVIDLRPGSVSTIAGTPLTIAPGTLIENARGGDGNDLIIGNLMNNLVVAGRGNDNVSGGPGDDALYGGEGNDAIAGGPGKDVLVGGGGADAFNYFFVQDSAGLGYDIILDFQPGIDRIDLSPIDANPFLPGDQAFTFVPGGLVGVAGQLTLVGNSLFGDTNGDRIPDLDIYLANVSALGGRDLVL